MTQKPYILHATADILHEDGDNPGRLIKEAEALLTKLGIGIIKSDYHLFKPQGVTLLYILSESHLAIHTWPEYNYLHLDIVTCTKTLTAKEIEAAIRNVYNVLGYKQI